MKKKIRQALCLVTVFLFAVMTMLPSQGEEQTAEPSVDTTLPLANIICLPDIGAAFTSDDFPKGVTASRKTLYDFCRTLSAGGKSDALLVMGDLSDNRYMTEEQWQYALRQVSEVLSEASDTVLYTVGNTDYYAGEQDGYNSADFYSTVMTDRFGTLYYWDFYYETVNEVRYVTAYRYRVNDIFFYFLNPAPTDMAGALRFGNFVYTEKSMSWVEKNMKSDDPNGDALMFLSAHFPLEGDGKQTGTLTSSASERLTGICAAHANLVYLYTDSALASDTASAAVEYTDEGLVLTDKEQTGIGESSEWTLTEEENGTYLLENVKSGKYLSLKDNELNLSEEAVSWNVVTENGRILLYASDMVSGVRMRKSGGASFEMGKATPLELYAVSDDGQKKSYTYAAAPVSGTSYVLVAGSRYVLTGENEGVTTGEMRVIGDELVETEVKTATDGTASFTALSAGAYDGDVLQYLTFTVYADRVEFQLNNRASDGTVTTLSAYTRTNRPTPEKKAKKSGGTTTKTEDVFDTGTYLLFLAGAGAVGAVGSTAWSVAVSKKRFFE